MHLLIDRLVELEVVTAVCHETVRQTLPTNDLKPWLKRQRGKHGSWLNLAEIELSVLSRQCLDRRIGDWNLRPQEVTAWTARRNQPQRKINWRFTTTDARIKLKKFCPSFED